MPIARSGPEHIYRLCRLGNGHHSKRLLSQLCARSIFPPTAKMSWIGRRFAGSVGARLLLIHAIPALVPAQEVYYQQDWREELASGARDQLQGLQRSVGTKAEQLVVARDALHTVCAQAKGLGADVLVIGRSSESGLLGRLRTNAYAIIRGRTAQWSVFEFAFGKEKPCFRSRKSCFPLIFLTLYRCDALGGGYDRVF